MMKSVMVWSLATALVGAVAWPYVKMEFASSAYYRQSDGTEYNYYTLDLLKRMPRISPDYSFQYMSNHDSPSVLHGIRFEGTTETISIRNYLKSEGYEQQSHCATQAECWQNPGSTDVVSLYSVNSPDYVVVQMTGN